jgi:NitT/TauT family transport system substrate-binding protein
MISTVVDSRAGGAIVSGSPRRSRRALLKVALASVAVHVASACAAPAAAPAPPTTAPAAPTAPAPPTTAPAAPTTAPATTALAPVRVGLVGGTSDAGFFIADERGYFKDANIAFQFTPFQSGPDMVPPAGNGQLDVATGAPSAGLFNAIARGIPLRIVADKGSQKTGFIFSSIALRKDLLDNGTIKGWADLKGQKMAVAGLGNSGQVFLDHALQRGGLTWHDVDLTMLSYADMGAALANKAIYGGVTIEPFRTQWLTNGTGGYLPDDDQIYLDQQAAVVMYGPQFIQSQADVARRFMVAYLRGIRDYNDAFVKHQNRETVVDILARRTALTDRAVYDRIGLPALDPNGNVLSKDLEAQQTWYLDNGYQNMKIDISSVVDSQYAEYAAQQLGRYA